jgi:hypothetical protein
MDDNGIQHKTITPLWPQANESETFMKPLMKAIRTAHLQKQNWRRLGPLENFCSAPVIFLGQIFSREGQDICFFGQNTQICYEKLR